MFRKSTVQDIIGKQKYEKMIVAGLTPIEGIKDCIFNDLNEHDPAIVLKEVSDFIERNCNIKSMPSFKLKEEFILKEVTMTDSKKSYAAKLKLSEGNIVGSVNCHQLERNDILDPFIAFSSDTTLVVFVHESTAVHIASLVGSCSDHGVNLKLYYNGGGYGYVEQSFHNRRFIIG